MSVSTNSDLDLAKQLRSQAITLLENLGTSAADGKGADLAILLIQAAKRIEALYWMNEASLMAPLPPAPSVPPPAPAPEAPRPSPFLPPLTPSWVPGRKIGEAPLPPPAEKYWLGSSPGGVVDGVFPGQEQR